MKSLIFLALIAAISGSMNQHWGERTTPVRAVNPPPTYIINLDLPPAQRWTQVVNDFREEIIDAIKVAALLIPKVIFEITPEYLVTNYNNELALELIGIADQLNYPVSYLFWVNLLYELETYCTSIVIQDKNNNIFHGRNLDWNMNNVLEPIMLVGDFQSNGTTVFKASVIAGQVAFLTGMRPGAFAISADQRASTIINEDWNFYPEIDDIELAVNLYGIVVLHRMGMMFSLRAALQNATTYQEAYNMLATTPIVAPVYFIISGTQPGEGAVLEMNRQSVHASYDLNATNGTWYLVQTNYDRNLPDPESDDRRTVAEERLDAIGKENINEFNLFSEVLSLYPNNNNGTLQTVIFSASEALFNVTVWWTHEYDNSTSSIASFEEEMY